MHELTPGLQLELVGRLALAVVLGSVLGWERQMGRHPAGLRTHMLVSLGAAAYTVAGAYGGWALLSGGVGTVEDPGRVAAQIITGIGFLGAGTIWRASAEENVIRGLTTAASIWVAASIGMLSGYGLYVLAAGTAILSFVVLRLVRGVEHAPRVISTAVTQRFRRSRAAARDSATLEPVVVAQAGTAMETGQAEAGGAPIAEPVTEDARAGPVGERLPRKLRKSKKRRKRTSRALPSEQRDEISDDSVAARS